ncbi:CLUMA_CG002106, isoform A [Clunio marinus]|uniref:CLUMA_CG002106, isoform A n=1 Tax=Clunio marinus TaxID=568069 RepID=A0A1J1HJV9_9DIPT|nr:CLUMA_CG002106, isoform A [Clunio marinus]
MYLTMESADDRITIMVISSVTLVTLISALAVCLCCRRRNPKSELAGIEGIVKLKHLDDSNLTVSIDTTDSNDALNPKMKLTQKNATLPLDSKLNGFQDNELKRSSANAPHRSLPDIPIVEVVCDNNSELYATVGDKLNEKPNKSPSSPKKLANLSQHSSMSQADDTSSPYARVRSPPHAYDKLKKTEHPYAQVVQPASAGGVAQVVLENDGDEDDDDDDDDEIDDEDETAIENPISHRESSSNHDLLASGGASIDASAAISGRISASQELPYMTPPIVPVMPPTQQHFSGDSQDSSKGYTSISVREPLANIIAQTNQQNAQRRRREIQDSHYATVSDDSDEMYAAIEDPNNFGELYTSGSETYAQIQAPMTVSVEINATAPPAQSTNRFNRMSGTSNHQIDDIASANVETLKNLHSRQASSSSCTSSVGNNIGSPKPEKRQANSPLPPTPKGQHQSRNSTSSIMEYHEGAKIKDSNNNSSKVKQSPSKDLEGMYAKVMKKNKLSSVPSENSSPVLNRHETASNDVTIGNIEVSQIPTKIGNEYETIDKKRNRCGRNTETSNAGYETIPADRNNNNKEENKTNNKTSPHYAEINDKREKSSKAKMSLFKESAIGYDDIQHLSSTDDPKYETLKLDKNKKVSTMSNATDSDYDPNYEIVMNKTSKETSSSSSSTLVDYGYSQIEKKMKDVSDDDESIPGYSTIRKPEPNYSMIGEKHHGKLPVNSINDGDNDSNLYSSIPPVVQSVITPSTDSNCSDLHLDYDLRTSTTNSITTPTTLNNNYETLSNSESTTIDEPNYESMKYLKENPYERLHNEKSSSPDPSGDAISPSNDNKKPNGSTVGDYFKV